MSEEILKVQNLKKYFNTSKGKLHAVDDVSFSIEKGKTLGIVGESGCGKSTLGRMIVKSLDATAGNIVFNGEDITNCSTKKLKNLRTNIQLIFQDPYNSINPRMSIGDIIGEPLIVNTNKKRSEVEKLVLNTMEKVGLDKRLINSYPHELDGGRRQRVGIARALILNPQFIVCDEPVSALDVSIQAQILNLLMDIQKEYELTYMFITHDLSVVKHISNNIMVMYLGQIVEMSSSEDLFENPSHPYTQALLKSILVPDLSKKLTDDNILTGEVSSPIEPKPGCRFYPRCSYKTDNCLKNDVRLNVINEKHFTFCNRNM